jgi:hypothetical protein
MFSSNANVPPYLAKQPSYDGYIDQNDNKELVAPPYFPNPGYMFAAGDEKKKEGFYDV